MLKKFFTVFLGSMAAIWFSILVFIAILAISLFSWMGNLASGDVKPNSVLYLDLSGEITDRYSAPSIKEFILNGDDGQLSFNDISKAIDLAKTDSNIKGIYINLQGSTMGLAMRQELRQILSDFKTTGKWIVAYGDNYDRGDYFTASIADEVYINPSGSLASNGMGVSVPFFKNALDKLGVEVQVIKVGTFKSAVEPFILTQMSDSARLQYDVMLHSMWNGYVSDVVADRKLPSDSAAMFTRMAATPMTAFTAPQLVDAKLFDGTKYAYEVQNMLKAKAGSDKDLNLITPADYLATFNETKLVKFDEKHDHIAVLYAVGDIVDSGDDGIVGDKMAPLIVSLAENEHVKGLVLRINSGGGSAFASEQIWASLEYFKSKDKPFVVSMGDVAASGGYYIACGADKIFADPATTTGSIGIFGIIPYARDLLNNKLGINFSVVETNPNAVFPRLDAPLTPDQRRALEISIHNGYDLFVSRVAHGRHMEDSAVRRIAEGRVWAGSTALEIGLVDKMGGLADAIALVATQTGLSNSDIVEYPKVKLTVLEMILSGQLNAGEIARIADAAVQNEMAGFGLSKKEIVEGRKIVNRLRNMGSVQAKMEDIVIY